MGGFLAVVVGVLLAALFGGLVIWIVGKLGLGLAVDGFGPAYIAAIVIALLNGVIAWLLSTLGISFGWLTGIANLIIAAIVLMTAGSWIKGFRVNGFIGGIVGAVAISLVAFLISWVLGLFV
jgi:putative membrane protein